LFVCLFVVSSFLCVEKKKKGVFLPVTLFEGYDTWRSGILEACLPAGRRGFLAASLAGVSLHFLQVFRCGSLDEHARPSITMAAGRAIFRLVGGAKSCKLCACCCCRPESWRRVGLRCCWGYILGSSSRTIWDFYNTARK